MNSGHVQYSDISKPPYDDCYIQVASIERVTLGIGGNGLQA